MFDAIANRDRGTIKKEKEQFLKKLYVFIFFLQMNLIQLILIEKKIITLCFFSL